MASTTGASAPSSYLEFQSPRLLIRSAKPDDAEALSDFFSNPANFPYEPPNPNASVERYRNNIAKWAVGTAAGKSAFMLVERKEDKALVGFGGFNGFTPPGPPTPGAERIADVGLGIDHRYWRQGYGAEAFLATIDYGVRALGVTHYVMDTDEANTEWRAFVKALGVGDSETTRHSNHRDGGGMECSYKFDRAVWEAAKKSLQERGKWPL